MNDKKVEVLVRGNPILNQVAEPVTNFGSEELREVVEVLFSAMREKNGVGIAAPQIGISKRIFVYGFDYCSRYPDAPAVPVMAVINPEILWGSEDTNDYEEGCLSVPFKRGIVTRSNSIKFAYQDLDGKKHEKTVRGFEARIVQHETDHLNGVLISERAKELVDKEIHMRFKIISITAEYIKQYNIAVDAVARERKYLAFLTGPSMDMSTAFVQENIKGNWPHVVAIADNKVVGWCDISSIHRHVAEHVGSLGIGIIEGYRGKGIGEELMRVALQLAKDRGLTRIELTVRENNTRAINLYKKLGFVAEGLHLNAIRIDGKYENYISMALLF